MLNSVYNLVQQHSSHLLTERFLQFKENLQKAPIKDHSYVKQLHVAIKSYTRAFYFDVSSLCGEASRLPNFIKQRELQTPPHNSKRISGNYAPPRSICPF